MQRGVSADSHSEALHEQTSRSNARGKSSSMDGGDLSGFLHVRQCDRGMPETPSRAGAFRSNQDSQVLGAEGHGTDDGLSCTERSLYTSDNRIKKKSARKESMLDSHGPEAEGAGNLIRHAGTRLEATVQFLKLKWEGRTRTNNLPDRKFRWSHFAQPLACRHMTRYEFEVVTMSDTGSISKLLCS